MTDEKLSTATCSVFGPSPNPYEMNRNRVREIYWLSNPEGQIFIDEEEDIYVIRQHEKINVIGYLHCVGTPWIIDNTVFKFISDLKNLCNDKAWSNYEITVITNFNLSHISYQNIKNLPIDINYFLLENKFFEEAKPSEPEPQVLKNVISESKSRYRRSKITPHSDSGIDPEYLIMPALKNGNGDSLGY